MGDIDCNGLRNDPVDAVDALREAGVDRGDLVAVAVAPGVGLGLAAASGALIMPIGVQDPASSVADVERAVQPRWVMWSSTPASVFTAGGVRLATAWDLVAVHRLIFGGWRADPAIVWARLHDLPAGTIPQPAPAAPDLFSQQDGPALDPERPVRPDGHLAAEWVHGAWSSTPERLATWAGLALDCAERQQTRLSSLESPSRAHFTARAESSTELLCAELACDGLPVDRATAEAVIAGFIGPRPRDETEAAAQQARRDEAVLRHASPGAPVDLRSPGQVRNLLRWIGVDLPDTRAWRLRALAGTHPLIDALLDWRKAERIATTYGYAWLDEHLHADGRLRGTWTGSDGAAGRMTASAGLHNMPADLRQAVVAEPGRVFVRADLGQIEPRVLAAVSGDRALAEATTQDDMYLPIAEQLGVDRATAKVAVLGAMYGQTTGHGARALRGLHEAYPVAMAHLDHADRAAQAGNDLRTYGGRLIPMRASDPGLSDREARSRAAARGRYGRNAIVQGAAAELFKVWALTVRARAAQWNATIVLCLHDELLVHAPIDDGATVARVVGECLQEAAWRWASDSSVRFVADIDVMVRWSDAKQ